MHQHGEASEPTGSLLKTQPNLALIFGIRFGIDTMVNFLEMALCTCREAGGLIACFGRRKRTLALPFQQGTASGKVYMAQTEASGLSTQTAVPILALRAHAVDTNTLL